MIGINPKRRIFTAAALAAGFFVLWSGPAAQNAPPPGGLLPQVGGWTLSDAAQRFVPQTLYEYIDGAAEAYIGYDFREAAVGQYRTAGTKASVMAEIYDMRTPLNAFGIYSAERFPDSTFLAIGLQGYVEAESLNFLSGRFYIKLMCYDGGDRTAAILKLFARDIAARIGDKGQWPALLTVFPKDGLVANSEKYVLRNYLGFRFLNNTYAASYNIGGQEFEAVLVAGKTPDEAAGVLAQAADQFSKSGADVERTPTGVRIKDKYLKNMYFTRVGNDLCGLIRVPDGQGALGEKHLKLMADRLAGRPGL